MNYDNALEALRLLNSPHGLGIGARHLRFLPAVLFND